MDLGTANTLLFTPKHGIVLNEPSVVAVDEVTGKVLAVGREAKEYIGRTPKGIQAIRPLKDGVIADFDVTQAMIAFFITKAMQGLKIMKPNIVIGVPSGITQVEKRAVIEAAEQAGASDVRLIEEPMAAAIGAGLPIHEPKGSMVIDIGGGTSEVAVISLSAIAASCSVRVAGDEMNEAVQRYCQEHFQLLIGENMAERAKMRIGSAYPLSEPMQMEISGKNAVTGKPVTIVLHDEQVREALLEPVTVIVDAVKTTLERTPPELTGDIGHSGLLLAGGGSLLMGLERLIAEQTGLKTRLDEDPLTTVVRGVGHTLEHRRAFEQVYIN